MRIGRRSRGGPCCWSSLWCRRKFRLLRTAQMRRDGKGQRGRGQQRGWGGRRVCRHRSRVLQRGGGWVGVPDGFPHAQQFAAGLLYTVAQVTYGTQPVLSLPGPSTLPVHSEPIAKFPFAQWPFDAYRSQVQRSISLLRQPGVSTQVPPAREGAESFRRERRDGKSGQAEAEADAKWEGSDESGNRT